MPDTFLPLETVRAAVAPRGGAVVASRGLCPVCAAHYGAANVRLLRPVPGGEESATAERDQRARELLEAALRALVWVGAPPA